MPDTDQKVRRTLHLKFSLPGADPAQLSVMAQASVPFYQLFGDAKVRLLQNVDDPGKYIQVIEYETPEAFELNRQKIAGDVRMQSYLQAWRAMLPGGVEIDVFQDV
jgi:hypothetical protein